MSFILYNEDRMASRIRPEVAAFAIAMERKLTANDHKGGWKGDTARALYSRVLEECNELCTEIQKIRAGNFEPRLVLDEAADIANFCMMIADVCGGLEGEE